MRANSKYSINNERKDITIEIMHQGSMEMLSFLAVFGVVVWGIMALFLMTNLVPHSLSVVLYIVVVALIVLWVIILLWYRYGVERVVLGKKQLNHQCHLFFLCWSRCYSFDNIRQVRLTTNRDFERSVGGAPWKKLFRMRVALVYGLDWTLLGQNISDSDAENMVSLIRGALEQ